MKRLLAVLCAALFLLPACAAPAELPAPQRTPMLSLPPAKTPAPEQTPEPAIAPQFTVSEALVMEVYTRLCAPEFEGRFAGTQGNERAAEYLVGLLAEYGYAPLFGDSMLVPYTAPMGDPGALEAEVELLLPDGSAHTLALGVDCAFALPWEDVSLTRPITSDAAEAAGGNAFLFAEEFARGAACAIVQCEPLNIRKHVRREDSSSGFCLYVTPEAGALCQTPGVRLRVSAKAAAWEGTAHNVVAVLPGADRSKAMVLGAHFDGTGTWGGVLCPSALDNASGTAALIGAASALAGQALPFDLVFVLFNSEENSLRGSEALAGQLLAQYEALNLVNLDCLGYAGDAPLSFCFQTKDSALATAIWPYLQHVGYPSYWIDAFVSSDHISFHASGIPAVTLSDSTDASGLYHTPQDVPELLDAGRIAAVAAGVATFLAQQAVPLAP